MADLGYEGRVAIITGAGGGLGREHALLLASRGAQVVINDLGGSVSGEGGDQGPAHTTAKEIEDLGGVAVADTNSVATVEGGEAIVKTALDAFGKEIAEIFMQKAMAWRTMHSQGRALMSLMMRHLDRLENYRIREAEFVCTTLVGWQFGDAHLHNEHTIEAVQKRCNFAPGECVIVWIESQPIHKKTLEYKVIDAALGVVERGFYVVTDAVNEQPWLPNGPIPHTVTWRKPDYRPTGEHTHPDVRASVSA